MLMSARPRKQRELFYWDGPLAADAELHRPILEAGDVGAAENVSKAVAKRLGLSDADIAALYPVRLRDFNDAYDPNEARDPHGQWTTGGGAPAGLLHAHPPGGTPGSEAPSGGPAITVYHGSHKDILDSVRQNGLTVRGHGRNFETGMYHGERGESMPIVFEVKIPVEQKFKLRQEEDYQRFVGNIPPNWITGYSVFSKKKDRWKKFHRLWKDATLGDHFYLAMLVDDDPDEDSRDEA